MRIGFQILLFTLCILAGIGEAGAACSSPNGNAGDMFYNSGSAVMQFCNGTTWISAPTGPGTGSGCASPSGSAGDMFFNSHYSVMQYCNGHEWVAMGAFQRTTSAGCSNNANCVIKITTAAGSAWPALSSCTAPNCSAGYTSVGCQWGESTSSFNDSVLTNGAKGNFFTRTANGFGDTCTHVYAGGAGTWDKTVCGRLCVK